jgi:Zn-dependent protease with chaperone function
MPDPIVVVPSGRRSFPGISSRAWEHPADRAALIALRAVPGFDLVIRWLFGLFAERTLRALYQGGAVRVGPRQFPRVHALWEECCAVLDVQDPPELYVSQNPVLNAGAVGMDRPFVVLTSGTVNALDDHQLRVVLGHELGHILSGHVLYKTMLRLLLRVSILALGTPITGVAMLALLAALLEWDRKSELSSDRAALLVAQNPDHVRAVLMRLAGGVGEGADLEAFREQARSFEEGGGALDNVAKLLALLGQSHPFAVMRLAEVDRWVETGDYERAMSGDYPRRADDPKESAWEAFKQTAAHYESTAEPVTRWVREAASGTVERARSWWRSKDGRDDDGPAGGSASGG